MVHLDLEAKRRAEEEEHARIEADEEAHIVEDARLKSEEEEQEYLRLESEEDSRLVEETRLKAKGKRSSLI